MTGTSPLDGFVSTSEESPSESSDSDSSSYLNTDLGDIDNGEIDTTEEVSTGMAMVVLKLDSQAQITCF